VPYAFTEELTVGLLGKEFLDDDIKENADKLHEFFGDFIGVMPPPTFRNSDEVGLIYNDGKNKYKVKYYLFDMKNGKICNIKTAD
jgi:hypothetical protein